MRRSEIADYLICPQKWQYRWREKLVPPQAALAPFVGIVYHSTMQRWLTVDPSNRSELMLIACLKEALLKHQDDVDDDRLLDAKELLKPMIRAYYQQFGNDAEIYGLTEVPVEHSGITATLDGIIERSDGKWLIEHKTGDPDDEMLVLNSFQTDLYHYLARQCGHFLKGTIITIVQRPRENARVMPSVRRWYMEVNDAALEDAWSTAIHVSYNINMLKQVHRNRDVHCGWCSYKWICRTYLMGGDEEAVKQHNFVKEDDISEIQDVYNERMIAAGRPDLAGSAS